ncbi:MAG: hypothetical protein H6599_03365 [Flavobacteriales bacterium]|nr:hypothetical protein [Flavobacteriales bacterium]
MKKLSFFLLLILVISGSAQNKKFISSIKSGDPKKLEKLSAQSDYQEQLNYHLVYAVHTFDSSLLDLCIMKGADPLAGCNDCFGRDAITVALYYQNYYAYEKLKPLYDYKEKSDELGSNILHAAATCKPNILKDVIETYHPQFIIGDEGSPLVYSIRDSLYYMENTKILLDNYGKEKEIMILNERDADYGTTVLFDATYFNHFDLVKLLVEFGFSPFTTSIDVSEEDFSADYVGSPFLASFIHDDHKIYDYYRTLNYDFGKFKNWQFLENEDETILIEGYEYPVIYSSIAFFICQNTNEEFVKSIENEFEVDYNVVDFIEYDTPMLFAVADNNKMMVKRILDQDWNGLYYKTALKWSEDKGIDPEIHELLETYVNQNIK